MKELRQVHYTPSSEAATAWHFQLMSSRGKLRAINDGGSPFTYINPQTADTYGFKRIDLPHPIETSWNGDHSADYAYVVPWITDTKKSALL